MEPETAFRNPYMGNSETVSGWERTSLSGMEGGRGGMGEVKE